MPPGSDLIWNTLCDAREAAVLVQNLVMAKLPDNAYIDVSWYPEHDPGGSYAVTVYCEAWENQIQQIETRDVQEVVRLIESLAAR